MTIQAQADRILAKAHQHMTPDQLDELFLKLAQDREALLKACRMALAELDHPLVDIFQMRLTLTAAVAQAERK